MKHHGIRPKVSFKDAINVCETEHAKYLDPKVIMKQLARGQPISLSQTANNYGVDDTNQTKMDVLIQKQSLKEQLDAVLDKELTKEELAALKKVAPGLDLSKVKVKKGESKKDVTNDEQNNEIRQKMDELLKLTESLKNQKAIDAAVPATKDEKSQPRSK